jgi:hypothetical protein
LVCLVNNDNPTKTNTTMTTAYLNEITRQLTCFASFADLLNAPGNYRPSIYLAKGDVVCHAAANRAKIDLALAYDDAQEARGDERRAFRGNWTN